MKKLSTINEKFVNLFDREGKEKYVDLIWNMLQDAYKSQGGIKGSGFNSKDDMIDNIPMWKIGKTGGKVVCIAMLKDKDGRKRVAAATDGTDAGKARLLEIMIADLRLGRCYTEISGNSLKFLKKNAPDLLKKHLVSFEVAKAKMAPKQISRPEDDDSELILHPDLKEFFYTRQLGAGVMSTKLMVGNPDAGGFEL